MVPYREHCSISLVQFNAVPYREWVACCHTANYRLRTLIKLQVGDQVDDLRDPVLAQDIIIKLKLLQ